MYTVLKRLPTIGDATIRWHIGYAHMYGRNHKMSALYSTLGDKHKYPGIPITGDLIHLNSIHPVGKGDRPFQSFTCSLNKLRMRSSNYWEIVRDGLS